jgi:hypothetical protein
MRKKAGHYKSSEFVLEKQDNDSLESHPSPLATVTPAIASAPGALDPNQGGSLGLLSHAISPLPDNVLDQLTGFGSWQMLPGDVQPFYLGGKMMEYWRKN